VKYLNLFTNGEEVSLDSMIRKGIIDGKQANVLGVKILGDGELKVALKVGVPCSRGATKKIIKAGGELINQKKENA